MKFYAFQVRFQNIGKRFELGEKKPDAISFEYVKKLWQYPSCSALTLKTNECNKPDKYYLRTVLKNFFKKYSIITETFHKV